MKLKYLFILLVFLILYLCFYPVPIDPVSWQPPQAPKLEGVFAKNDRLSTMTLLYEGQCYHCEDVAIDSSGHIYAGTETGDILRFEKGKKEPIIFAKTGGRPLGLHFDRDENLIVADGTKGVLSIDKNGKITVLTDSYNGKKINLVDDLEIADDGVIYFSDASSKFGLGNYTLDLFEHRPNGALYSYNPQTKKTSLLLDDLYFANGIAIDHDQQFVLVVQTGAYNVIRYWIAGDKKGQHDTFIENLPGFPDGISQGADGLFWLALVSPRKADLDNLMTKPFLRKVIVRLPKFIQPAPETYGFVVGLDKNAKVIHNLQDPTQKFGQITSVQQYKDKLYLGTLGEKAIAVTDVPN